MTNAMIALVVAMSNCLNGADLNSVVTNRMGLVFSTNEVRSYVVEERVVTNWVTVSRTVPESPISSGGSVDLLYRVTTLNQVGIIMRQKVGVIDWKGKRVECILEEVELGEKPVRSIPDSPLGFLNAVITPCGMGK